MFIFRLINLYAQSNANKVWRQLNMPSGPSSEPRAAAPFTPHAPAHDLTGSDVEAFLDGMMPSQLERENVAGAVIAVVKDGHVIFAKGNGYSDIEKRKPVTPYATLFRPGSF